MCDCIFCKIANGQAPCYKIYEDEFTMAFLDISKDCDGHTLVIPKQHCENIFDCGEELLGKVMATVKKVAEHYRANCGYGGVNILNANDKSAQQSVFHLHFHVLPRKLEDGVDAFPVLNGAKNELSQMHEILTLVK